MWASGRNFWKNVESLPKVMTPVRRCTATSPSEIPVAIPKRIQRGPTDILKALSSTIQIDSTAFPYKYPDDPYFYPFSNQEKRVYALSMESGRKSARWIINNNPGFFKNQLSDPPIQDFLPKVEPDENSQVTEETLLRVIERRDVVDAMSVYQLLQKRDIGISNQVKQSLLELVCFYNSGEKANVEELESKWFGNVEHDRVVVNTWKEQSFAESLFESMNRNCPLANSAIIQGMIRYNSVQRAVEIFNEARKNKVKLGVGVYNSVLSQASNNSVDIPDGMTFINTLLKEMAEEKINPNLGTLNAVLQSLVHLRGRGDYAKELVMEFLHLGIFPSLGTYYYLFRILGQNRMNARRNRNLLVKLLTVVRNTRHELRHPSDFLFFPQVMYQLVTTTGDIQMITLLNEILFQDGNIKFLENSFSENSYFRNYVSAVFKMEPIEVAMEKYRKLVPTMYSPEQQVLSVVLSTVIANGSWEYLAELWEDLKRFRMNRYLKLLDKILALANVLTKEGELKVIKEAGLSALEYFEEFGLERAQGEMASHLVVALLKTEEVEKALKVFEQVTEPKSQSAVLTEDAVLEVFQYALGKRKAATMMDCLRYGRSEGFPRVVEMAEKALPFLSESERTWATELITEAKEREREKESSE